MSTILSLWTVAVFVIFVGIVIWVLSKKKEDFDEQAYIPFTEDEEPGAEMKNKEANNG